MPKRRARGRSERREGQASAISGRASPLRGLGLGLLLCGLTFFSYLPSLRGGFIWDDKVLLSENGMVRAPDGLSRFWFSTEAYDYWPLTATTYWIEWRVWGATSIGYHVTNVVLHCAEALLLWAVLTRLGVGGAYLAALLFALHPVNVESVAWIAQRKNLVAMLFLELATLAYLRADADPPERSRASLGWYALSVTCFVLAILGKGSAAVLPLVLLLLSWWRLRPLKIAVMRLVPFAVIGVAGVLVNIWFQTHGGNALRDVTFVQRLLGAGAAVWFYLWKAVVPLRLAFVYPEWHVDPARLGWWIPDAAALATSVLLWRKRHGAARPLFLAWTFFCIGLLPVMGLADVYFMKYALVADHYQHIAIIGVVASAAAAWSLWRRHDGSVAPLVAAALLVAGFVTLTRRQSATYRDEKTLYAATVENSPRAWLAHFNLAVILSAEGRRAEAIDHYQEALAAKADLVDARVNLGLLLDADGRASEAISALEEALRIDPNGPRIHYNLGTVLAKAGRLEGAVQEYGEAVRLQPSDAENQNALGTALDAVARHEEASHCFEEALRLRPGYADAEANLALALAHLGRRDDAIAAYREAVRLKPESAIAHYNLGSLLVDAGRRSDALGHYEEALRLAPDYALAHNGLALALLAEGRIDEARLHFEQAVRLRPDLIEARVSLVEVAARSGRAAEADAEARETLSLARASGRIDVEKRMTAWLARHGGS